MKAAQFDDGAFDWVEVETPPVAGDEVLVKVHAAGINRADLVQLAGRYNPPPGASSILGLEAAGEVIEVGADIDPDWIGKRVCALLTGGGYAQYVNVPLTHTLEMPETMTFLEAAAIPEAFLTAFINVFLEPGLEPGETVLLHAAASGVGVAALQLCRGTNPVIGVCGGAKHETLEPFSPLRLIDRGTEDFEAIVVEMGGVDVILDPVGGPNLAKNLNCLKSRGRLVNIGLLGGRDAQFDMGRLLVKRLRIIGSVLRSRSAAEKETLIASFRERFWDDFYPAGSSDPKFYGFVHDSGSIHHVLDAHETMRANQNIGKLVLEIPHD